MKAAAVISLLCAFGAAVGWLVSVATRHDCIGRGDVYVCQHGHCVCLEKGTGAR